VKNVSSNVLSPIQAEFRELLLHPNERHILDWDFIDSLRISSVFKLFTSKAASGFLILCNINFSETDPISNGCWFTVVKVRLM